MDTGGTMNGLLWIAQVLLAGVFSFTGFTKLFAYERLVKTAYGRRPRLFLSICLFTLSSGWRLAAWRC
jgi:hypothetical protein